MTPRTLLFAAASLVALIACGSSSSTDPGSAGAPGPSGGPGPSGNQGNGNGNGNGGKPDSGTPPACVSIAAAGTAKLMHVDATGAKAKSVLDAITAVLAAHKPAINPTGATFPSVSCRNVDGPGPGGGNGYGCSLSVVVGGGAPEDVETDSASLAETLFTQLDAAGTATCHDLAHGDFIKLRNLTVTATDLHFDDVSTYDFPPSPNVSATGSTATDVVAAFAAGGIVDCNAAQKAFIVCNTMNGPPDCGYHFEALSLVGTSELRETCMPSGSAPGSTLDAAASLAMWKAILAAAKASAFVPDSGTLADTTVVNASFFQWDGTKLGFSLVTGNATPPPPPPPPPPPGP